MVGTWLFQRASINNKTYGFCRLHDEAKIPCPYKGCVHADPPPQEEGFDPKGEIAAQMVAETQEEHGLFDAMEETDPVADAAETMASEIEAIAGEAPGDGKVPGDDLR